MKTIIDVNTGQVELAQNGVILRALAIGSCIVAVVIDYSQPLACMAHIMLPGLAGHRCESQDHLRYAENAFQSLTGRMHFAGGTIENSEVFLIGAGNVLVKADDKVCRANARSVLDIINRANLKIRATVLGGFQRKSVIVDIEAGSVVYSRGDQKEQLLWQWNPPQTSRRCAGRIAYG